MGYLIESFTEIYGSKIRSFCVLFCIFLDNSSVSMISLSRRIFFLGTHAVIHIGTGS